MLLLFASAGPEPPPVVASGMGSMSRFLLLGVSLLGRIIRG